MFETRKNKLTCAGSWLALSITSLLAWFLNPMPPVIIYRPYRCAYVTALAVIGILFGGVITAVFVILTSIDLTIKNRS